MTKPPYSFENLIVVEGRVTIDRQRRCPHCLNTALVIPDTHPAEVWPCPMCALGRKRSAEFALGALHPERAVHIQKNDPPGASVLPCYFAGFDLTNHRWNNYMHTGLQRWCSEPGCGQPAPNERNSKCVEHTPKPASVGATA